jgi:hypothetical protein
VIPPAGLQVPVDEGDDRRFRCQPDIVVQCQACIRIGPQHIDIDAVIGNLKMQQVVDIISAGP